MTVPFSEQELAEFILDRIIVHCPKCPEVACIRYTSMKVAEELLDFAEISYKGKLVSDGGD